MVEVHIPAIALSWLKPAPVSLIDGGPVGGHAVLLSRGTWVNHRVVASVGAATAQLAADNTRQQMRSLMLPIFGLLAIAVLLVISSAVAVAGHFVVGNAILIAGILVCFVLSIASLRGRRRRVRILPINIRQGRDGGVVVSPVHPAAAQAWADANPAGSMRIVDLPAEAAGPIER